VRDGRTLVLVNLISKVAPFDASSGSGGACEGALVVLRVELSGDGKALTVADEAGCGCEQAQKLLNNSTSGDAEALKLQAREVKASVFAARCVQMGGRGVRSSAGGIAALSVAYAGAAPARIRA
jgi:hypothetical protein